MMDVKVSKDKYISIIIIIAISIYLLLTKINLHNSFNSIQ